jgi:hypothetical protein
MQVLSIMEMKGDPDEILANMKEVEDVAARKAPGYGAISNTVVKTDDGIMIINHWGDEEGRHKLADDPEIQAALQKIEMRPDFRAYEVMRYRTADES